MIHLMESTHRASARNLDRVPGSSVHASSLRFGLDPVHVRTLGLLAAACAAAMALVLAGDVMVQSSVDFRALAILIGVLSVALGIAAIVAGKPNWSYGLDVAGVTLMLLGVAAGAMLPDGLDAAAILPLGGAVLTLPREHGRPLLILFVAAFAFGMAGETAAYTVGGMSSVVGRDNVPRSLAESGVMLALIYGVVWWVGDKWWAATSSAHQSLSGQRRLLEVNERLQTTLDPEGVLGLIADSLKAVLIYDNLTIYRVDRVAGVMRPVVARDRFAQLIMGTTIPISAGITGWVVAHGEAQCVNDSAVDPRVAIIPGTPDEPESLIVVPLFVRGQVAGTLNVGRMGRREAFFTSQEFEMARLFAGQASIALQNAETHRAVSDKAETDALTGLGNRGSFNERLEALTSNPAAQPCALVIIDLDRFHEYNTRYLHTGGDTALKLIAGAIVSAVRDRDQAFRYGGDEFAVLLPRTDLPRATAVAERIRLAIADLGTGLPTASLGVACTSSAVVTAKQLLYSADAASFEAKDSGGNQVHLALEDPAA
jgi:diguanylate cyclase (GGDEF)-like protein